MTMNIKNLLLSYYNLTIVLGNWNDSTIKNNLLIHSGFMKINGKTLLRLGAAVLVGAAVFIGSTISAKSSERPCNGPGAYSGPVNPGGPICGGPSLVTETSSGFRDVQSAMMKTSQLITTMITICDAVSRLFVADPMPRYYTSSTTIL